MSHYSAYGVLLSCDVLLPGLRLIDDGSVCDVSLFTRSEPTWLREARERDRLPWQIPDGGPDSSRKIRTIEGTGCIEYSYSDGTTFFINPLASEIWAEWPSSLTLEDMTIYLVGPVLGFLLALRGVTALHASAISVSDRAIALVGGAHAGKSTTAAAFGLRGYPVLTEDVAALREDLSGIHVLPGYPLIRLWPESAEILFGSKSALPLLAPGWDKRYLALDDETAPFCDEAMILSAVYCIGERVEDDSAPRVDPMTRAEALVTLIGNSYAGLVISKEMRASEFSVLSRLVQSVPVRRLIPHADPSRLGRLCDVVLADFATT